MDWITHEEDVWFDFRGDDPHQLTPGRYYKGTVDGFAEFGVFVDLARGVTGLLHRSELDRRLESLPWEAGDTVFVQVKNVRKNGNVDLGWSKRQSEREFRGALVHDPTGEHDGEPIDVVDDDSGPIKQRPQAGASRNVSAGRAASRADATDERGETDEDESEVHQSPGTKGEPAAPSESGDDRDSTGDVSPGTRGATPAPGASDAEGAEEPAADESARERVTIDSLADRLGDAVRIEGRIVDARQTGGPTVFEVRDETGIVDCAAFVEAGVRAYPEVGVGDYVRLDGEVERRRNELQVETESLVVLSDEEAATVDGRLADALTARARPASVELLAPHEPVEAVSDQLLDAAEAVRRAVLESRPLVVRHPSTADGYVAGAAIERAVLPLIKAEYDRADVEYHYFTRRPLDGTVYDMDAATNDVTRMLEDQERHGEKLPLVLLVGVGSTVESVDGLELLSIYGAGRVVVDAEPADEGIVDHVDVAVNPGLVGADATDLSTGALSSTLAATINPAVRDDLVHLPATSYWDDTPSVYADLAADAGYDADRVRELREAVALEAYYQSYQDKRELIVDILFGDHEASGNLAGHVSEQFRIKLDDEVETAEANVEHREFDGVVVAVLDTDAFSHRYDFPPTTLLVDEFNRRHRDAAGVTVAVATDELWVRSERDVDVRAIAAAAAERVPEGGVTAVGVREGRIEFLSGARDAVVDAVVETLAAEF